MHNCVNNETKTLYFGYGGIRVSATGNVISFQGIAPPVGAGNIIFDCNGGDMLKVGDWEYTGSGIFIALKDLDEVNLLRDLLTKVECNEHGTFTFKEVTFDFTSYDPASIRIVRAGIDLAALGVVRLIAC